MVFFRESAGVQLWALQKTSSYGNGCRYGALWLAAGERALYLDWAEAHAQGVNAHLCKQEFWRFFLLMEFGALTVESPATPSELLHSLIDYTTSVICVFIGENKVLGTEVTAERKCS